MYTRKKMSKGMNAIYWMLVLVTFCGPFGVKGIRDAFEGKNEAIQFVF